MKSTGFRDKWGTTKKDILAEMIGVSRATMYLIAGELGLTAVYNKVEH